MKLKPPFQYLLLLVGWPSTFSLLKRPHRFYRKQRGWMRRAQRGHLGWWMSSFPPTGSDSDLQADCQECRRAELHLACGPDFTKEAFIFLQQVSGWF